MAGVETAEWEAIPLKCNQSIRTVGLGPVNGGKSSPKERNPPDLFAVGFLPWLVRIEVRQHFMLL
jgi:hypothetical protein